MQHRRGDHSRQQDQGQQRWREQALAAHVASQALGPRDASADPSARSSPRERDDLATTGCKNATQRHAYIKDLDALALPASPMATPSTATPGGASLVSTSSFGSLVSSATSGAEVRSVDELLSTWRARRATRRRSRDTCASPQRRRRRRQRERRGESSRGALKASFAIPVPRDGPWEDNLRRGGESQEQVGGRWSRAMRLSELERMQETECSISRGIEFENDKWSEESNDGDDPAVTSQLRIAFVQWLEVMREHQFQEIRELSAMYYYDVALCQKAFSGWKLVLLDQLWRRAVEHHEMRMKQTAWKPWAMLVKTARRMRLTSLERARVDFLERRRQETLRRHLTAWRSTSERRIEVRARGTRVRQELCTRAWLRRWKQALEAQKLRKLAHILVRRTWKVLKWQWKAHRVWKAMPQRLECLRRTAQYRNLVRLQALEQWRGFVKARRLAAYYGDLREVLAEMQVGLLSRQRRRWRVMYTRTRARLAIRQWRKWTQRDREHGACYDAIQTLSRKRARRHVLWQWRRAAREKRCNQRWSVLLGGLQAKAQEHAEIIAHAAARRLVRCGADMFREWRQASRAERHRRHREMRRVVDALLWACARHRVQMRMAVVHAEKMRARSAFCAWRRAIILSADWERAVALHGRHLLRKMLARWRWYVDALHHADARERALERQLSLGWFAEVRLEAARAYHYRRRAGWDLPLQTSHVSYASMHSPARPATPACRSCGWDGSMYHK